MSPLSLCQWRFKYIQIVNYTSYALKNWYVSVNGYIYWRYRMVSFSLHFCTSACVFARRWDRKSTPSIASSQAPFLPKAWSSWAVDAASRALKGLRGKTPSRAEHLLFHRIVWTILWIQSGLVYSQCQNYRTEPGGQKYGKIVLLRVPIRSGVGKFNYRTGRRTKVRYFTVLLSSWLRSIISGTDMIFTAYLYIYNL